MEIGDFWGRMIPRIKYHQESRSYRARSFLLLFFPGIGVLYFEELDIPPKGTSGLSNNSSPNSTFKNRSWIITSWNSIGAEWYIVVARILRDLEYDDSLKIRTIRVRRKIFNADPKDEEEPLVVEEALSITKYGIIAIRSIMLSQSLTNLNFSGHDRNRRSNSIENQVLNTDSQTKRI